MVRSRLENGGLQIARHTAGVDRLDYKKKSELPRKTIKKAQLTQGLRATAHHSKMAVSRHLGYYQTANSAIRSTDHEKPYLEPNMEWIGCTVCEIFDFKLHCDLETGVRGHSRSSKVALLDRAHTTLYSSYIVCLYSSYTVCLYLVPFQRYSRIFFENC